MSVYQKNLRFFRRRGAGTGHQSQARFSGHIDDINDNTIQGWAIDREENGGPGGLLIIYDDVIVDAIKATDIRDDVAAEMTYQGPTGFRYTISRQYDLFSGKISVFVVDKEIFKVASTAVKKRDASVPASDVVFSETTANFDKKSLFRLKHTSVFDSKIHQFHPTVERAGGSIEVGDRHSILIEIQDLLSFLRVNNRVTGIQRTVIGILYNLMNGRAFAAFNFKLCAVSDFPGCVYVFDFTLVERLIESVRRGDVEQAVLFEQIGKIFSQSKLHKTTSHDSLIISGAYWIVDNYSNKINSIRKNGTIIGTYIYDIIPLTSPQWVMASTNREVMESAFGVFSISDYFLSISNFVKTDLNNLLLAEFGWTKPIRAVPLPHQLSYAADATASSADRTLVSEGEAGSGYVLCVCTLEGRKNHLLLYRVWSALIRKHGFDAVPRLVLVGKWGWRIEEFREICESTRFLNGKISARSGLDDEVLADLYKECLFTVFPSFVEGWGLPVGESLAFGKACVASNASSIPEVGGNFVDYFDPHDYFGSLAAIEKMMFDDDHRRERTQNIVENFKPRLWSELANDFMDAISSSVDACRENAEEPVSHHYLAPGIKWPLTDLISDPLVSWAEKQSRFVLDFGWSSLENWGAWSSESAARIVFSTRLSEGTSITLWLEVCLPNIYQGEKILVKFDGGDPVDLTEAGLNQQPRWISMYGHVGANGIVSVTIMRPTRYAKDETFRKLFVGVSGLGYYEKNSSIQEIDFLKSLVEQGIR